MMSIAPVRTFSRVSGAAGVMSTTLNPFALASCSETGVRLPRCTLLRSLARRMRSMSFAIAKSKATYLSVPCDSARTSGPGPTSINSTRSSPLDPFFSLCRLTLTSNACARSARCSIFSAFSVTYSRNRSVIPKLRPLMEISMEPSRSR